VDLRDTPDEKQFRSELRAWLAENHPGSTSDAADADRVTTTDVLRDWSRRLHAAGYSGLTWPAEHGGAEKPYSYQAIFLEGPVPLRPRFSTGVPLRKTYEPSRRWSDDHLVRT